jgi:hypothetical protein
MYSHQVSSFFEVSAYTALSETVIADILDVWILGSVAGNRNRPRMHLLPFLSISKYKTPSRVSERVSYKEHLLSFLKDKVPRIQKIQGSES